MVSTYVKPGGCYPCGGSFEPSSDRSGGCCFGASGESRQHDMAVLRFDRFPSVHLFHPLARRTNRLSTERVPILMYHSIRKTESSAGPYYETSTSPAVFACHMKFLSDHNYATVTLDERNYRAHPPLPPATTEEVGREGSGPNHLLRRNRRRVVHWSSGKASPAAGHAVAIAESG